MYIKYQPVLQLCDVLGNEDFPLQLAATCKNANIEQDSPLVLHIEASLGPARGSKRILLVSCQYVIDMEDLLLTLRRVVLTCKMARSYR